MTSRARWWRSRSRRSSRSRRATLPRSATVKILEYKEMEPFFVKGESDEP